MGVVPGFNMNFSCINKSTEWITIKNIRYTIVVGHFSKGSERETYFKERHTSLKGHKGIVWYGEVIKPYVIGYAGFFGISKTTVIDAITRSITNGNTYVGK